MNAFEVEKSEYPHSADARLLSLRQRAEESFYATLDKTPEPSQTTSLEQMRRTLHDLQVHQVELAMQNEELRHAHVLLDAERARYFDFYDMAPVGYLTLSERGLIEHANLTAAAFLGSTRVGLRKQPISRFIVPTDQDVYYLFQKQLLATNQHHACELRLLKHHDAPLWVQLEAIAVQKDDGERTLRVVLSEIAQRKHADAALKQLLSDKEALIKEVHHRVKNNLQVVASLLRLENRRSAQAETKAVLSNMQGRISLMALLHESLYRSSSLASVELGVYLQQVATLAFKTQTINTGGVRLNVNLASVSVGMDQAITCGLFVNELISNALKHGFPNNNTGEINIELQALESGPAWRLRISDTGVGLPTNFEDKRRTSLGLQLVSDLASQLGGELDIGPGATFTVEFTINPLEPLGMHA